LNEESDDYISLIKRKGIKTNPYDGESGTIGLTHVDSHNENPTECDALEVFRE
jgi:hypothetical protein